MEEQQRTHDNTHGRKVEQDMVSSKALEENSAGDVLSSLPDHLLLRILSLLKMPDVVNTTLLSSRWRYLWTSISCLDFELDVAWDHQTSKLDFIHTALFHHKGSKIKKLRIFYTYKDGDTSKVDAWIYSALNRGVEELALDFFNGHYPGENWTDTRYKLPRSLFNCSSITTLTLSFCDLNMPAAPIRLSSLKKLSLELLDLATETITSFTSSCPRLEHLTLHGCNRNSNLIIVIDNQNIKSLEILGYDDVPRSTGVMICAQNLHSLKLVGFLPRGEYRISNLTSLKDATFSKMYDKRVFGEDDAYDVSMNLLGDLSYVAELRLCMSIVQIMAIREAKNLPPFCVDATCLKVEAHLTKWELPGLIYLLKSSPKLNSLTIEFPDSTEDIKLAEDFKDQFAFAEKNFWELTEKSFSSMFQKLESIEIQFLSGDQQKNDVEEVLEKL